METKKEMLYAGYGDMWQQILSMASRMPDVDAIAGVPVSGIAPAGMLSAATGIPAVPIEAIPGNIKKLLVLEDASSFATCKQQGMGRAEGREVLYGAVYCSDAALTELDFVGCIAPKPRIFTWNLFKSERCPRIAYDLDGVICENPESQEIDYADKYSVFLNEAARLRKTISKLGWIVSGRMERYRKETEKWLNEAGVNYRELVLAPDDQGHTMLAHAQNKAAWYQAHPECLLFVESDTRQTPVIAELTGRPVVCTETEKSYNTRRPDPFIQIPKKKNDKIIYTISTGDYEKYAPRKYIPPDGWDYRLVTGEDCPSYLTPKQQAAWAKINGLRLFREYKESLCIDDDMTILKDPAPILPDSDIMFLYRENITSWVKDLELVTTIRKAITPDKAEAEKNRLINAGFTDSPCYLSGVIYRRHVERVRSLCDEWWFWYSQSETQRDQPSLAIACQRLQFFPATILEQEIKEYIKHDIKKADRDGVRQRIDEEKKETMPHVPRRRGDRT